MSALIFRWRKAVVHKFSRLTSTERLVALTLSMHMNASGESCRPAIPLLEQESGLANSTVREALKRLVAEGYITREQRDRKVGRGYRYEYYATLPAWFALAEDGQGNPPTRGGLQEYEPVLLTEPS